jgi:hypothetical protein
MEVVAYLLRKAEQCRRLAAEFLNPNDPAVKNLLALAHDFEARAQRRRHKVPEQSSVESSLGRQVAD